MNKTTEIFTPPLFTDRNRYVFSSQDSAETIDIGQALGKLLPSKCVICFTGELAAGKTTFIKGLAQGAAACPANAVNSPTFVYLNIYEGAQTIYHFDLYRLHNADEFLSMGFDDFFSEGIVCIEWSERIRTILPPEYISVDIVHAGQGCRQITITHNSNEQKNYF